MDTMLLHASELEFEHPITHNQLHFNANLQSEFLRMKAFLNL